MQGPAAESQRGCTRILHSLVSITIPNLEAQGQYLIDHSFHKSQPTLMDYRIVTVFCSTTAMLQWRDSLNPIMELHKLQRQLSQLAFSKALPRREASIWPTTEMTTNPWPRLRNFPDLRSAPLFCRIPQTYASWFQVRWSNIIKDSTVCSRSYCSPPPWSQHQAIVVLDWPSYSYCHDGLNELQNSLWWWLFWVYCQCVAVDTLQAFWLEFFAGVVGYLWFEGRIVRVKRRQLATFVSQNDLLEQWPLSMEDDPTATAIASAESLFMLPSNHAVVPRATSHIMLTLTALTLITRSYLRKVGSKGVHPSLPNSCWVSGWIYSIKYLKDLCHCYVIDCSPGLRTWTCTSIFQQIIIPCKSESQEAVWEGVGQV